MTIFIQAANSTPIFLTGSKPEEGIDQAGLEFDRIGEAIACIRAETVAHRDRANAAHILQFAVTREHATPGAAADYFLTHAQSLPGKADVVFCIEEPGGQAAAERRLVDALIRARQGSFDGCSTTFHYTISGGLF